MINDLKYGLNKEIEKTAHKVAIKKLKKQGIDYQDLEEDDFQGIINTQKEILLQDVKKVGQAAAISAALGMIIGV